MHLVCLDVDYRADVVVTACVGFHEWADTAAAFESVRVSKSVAESYVPGHFARREMPYLLDMLASLARLPDIVVIDGYVFLDDAKPGLGALLHEALEAHAIVVGVAKTRFRGVTTAIEVFRGQSQEPLFVDAIGMPREDAAGAIAEMTGPYRIPTLIKRADQLARTGQGVRPQS